MQKRGFILPFTIILALVVLTSLGLWYRQVALQGFLANRLLQQRSLYIECRSLIPALKEKLDTLDPAELNSEAADFLIVEVDQQPRWLVDRSVWADGRVQFTFRFAGQGHEPLKLIVPYDRK